VNTLALLAEYTWRSPEFPLCTIDVPVAELAKRFGFALAHWEEPGLGSASGFLCRISPSGLVLFLEELAHAREYLGAQGPSICVETAELVENGIAGTLASALLALELSPANVTWVQTESGLAQAKRVGRPTS
jgi:hypothetical protein